MLSCYCCALLLTLLLCSARQQQAEADSGATTTLQPTPSAANAQRGPAELWCAPQLVVLMMVVSVAAWQ